MINILICPPRFIPLEEARSSNPCNRVADISPSRRQQLRGSEVAPTPESIAKSSESIRAECSRKSPPARVQRCHKCSEQQRIRAAVAQGRLTKPRPSLSAQIWRRRRRKGGANDLQRSKIQGKWYGLASPDVISIGPKNTGTCAPECTCPPTWRAHA
jgi:hypothetical protein